MTATYKNPQTVYIMLASYGHTARVTKGELLRRTPAGQQLVKVGTREVRFSKEGKEIGASSQWHYDRIIDQETYDRIAAENERAKREREVVDGVKALSGKWNYYGRFDKAEMEAALLALVEKVRAI